MSDKPRPLYVPDLSRPAGADVDAHGEITCVVCGVHASVMDADVVGKGYRCERCSMLATPEDNADASLSPAEQATVPDPPRARPTAIAGVVLLALSAVMWFAKIDFDLGLDYHRMPLFVAVGIAGVGSIAVALTKPKKWR